MEMSSILLLVFFAFIFGVMIGIFAPVVAMHIYQFMKKDFNIDLNDEKDKENGNA